ncbi:MAG TPA: NUDIX hydrolase [Microthrixaceae bacterium]|nr:NUDIX hydrolase [Microthrixaceae bacterium]
MREWVVAGAVIENDAGLLLVENLRRNGATDWTPPGGVIEADDAEDIRSGLAREVHEETGLTVAGWGELLYEVVAEAPALGWVMRAQIHLVTAVIGEVVVGNDPDGIVTDAAYVPVDACAAQLTSTHRWVSEPLTDWLGQRWSEPRSYRYRLEPHRSGPGRIVRL